MVNTFLMYKTLGLLIVLGISSINGINQLITLIN